MDSEVPASVGHVECFGDQCFVTFNYEPTVPPVQPPSPRQSLELPNTSNEHSITPSLAQATSSNILVPPSQIPNLSNPSPIQDILTSHVSDIAITANTPINNSGLINGNIESNVSPTTAETPSRNDQHSMDGTNIEPILDNAALLEKLDSNGHGNIMDTPVEPSSEQDAKTDVVVVSASSDSDSDSDSDSKSDSDAKSDSSSSSEADEEPIAVENMDEDESPSPIRSRHEVIVRFINTSYLLQLIISPFRNSLRQNH